MDFLHAVKQLVLEIELLETQLREKKLAFDKLWPALSPQEQLLIDSPSVARLMAPVAPPEPAPKEPKKPK